MSTIFRSLIASILISLIVGMISACQYMGNEGLDTSQDDAAELSSAASQSENEKRNSSSKSEAVSSPSSTVESSTQSKEEVSSTPQKNPSTSGSEGQETQTFTSYQEMLSAAESLEGYLRSKLSTEDYGGMCIWQQETVTIDLWVVNRDAIDSVLQSYSGKKVDISFKKARCSLEALTNLSNQMKTIETYVDESLNIYISESDNSLAVNISKIGADRLREEINTFVKSSGIPSECVVVFVIDPNGDNPVT